MTTTRLAACVFLASTLLLGVPVGLAVQRATAPADVTPTATVVERPVTARCRDGAVSYSLRRSGTCSGHGGVREWVNLPEW